MGLRRILKKNFYNLRFLKKKESTLENKNILITGASSGIGLGICEKLVEIHPWAEMVKLARTGGEANSIAVRIGRAASKKIKLHFVATMGGTIGICLQTYRMEII